MPTKNAPPGREGFGSVLALSTTGQVLAARALQTEDQPEPSVVVFKQTQGMWVERKGAADDQQA